MAAAEVDAAYSSSDADSDVPFILYRDRPDWKDVEPLPQDDGPSPVVKIAYSEKCRFFLHSLLGPVAVTQFPDITLLQTKTDQCLLLT